MRRPKSILILLLILGLQASFWRQGAFVLCFGDDGHIAVEPVSAEHCREPASTGPLVASPGGHLGPGLFGSGNPCGSCLDIPLAVSAGTAHPPSREGRDPRKHAALLLSTLFSTAGLRQADSQGPLQPIPLPDGNPADLLSCTILRI